MLRALVSAGVAAVVAANQQGDMEESCALQVPQSSSQEKMGQVSTPAPPSPCKPFSGASDFNLTDYISKPWYVQETVLDRSGEKKLLYCQTVRYQQPLLPSPLGYTISIEYVLKSKYGEKYDYGKCAYQTISNHSAKLAATPSCQNPKSAATPYWILYYEPPDPGAQASGVAIISAPEMDVPDPQSGKCNSNGLMILTGDPNPWDKKWIVRRARHRIAELGFDLSVLNTVNQTNCTYDFRELAVDLQGVAE